MWKVVVNSDEQWWKTVMIAMMEYDGMLAVNDGWLEVVNQPINP